MARPEGTEAAPVGPSSSSCASIPLAVWICILCYNETRILSADPPRVLWVVLASRGTQGGREDPQLCSQLRAVVRGPRAQAGSG